MLFQFNIIEISIVPYANRFVSIVKMNNTETYDNTR